ncbi:MAG: hypothetical protein K0S65_6107 [Labilithrix sp.]|nr:hypothetical protein [Labilithrix sp.]
MRRALSTIFTIAGVGVVFVLGGGCTFLISFDDAPVEDAGAPIDLPDRSAPSRDTGAPVQPDVDSGDANPPIPVTPACDTTFPLDQVKGCATFVEGGQICADNPGLTSYPGDRTKDVVTCSKAGATCVRHCVACAHLPEGFPDQCDQCIGKVDGRYCGTDMGWQPDNFRLLVTCTNERMAAVTPCSTRGCDSKGGTGSAACKP